MTPLSLSGNSAAAWAVRLAMVNYIPTFPMTPPIEIIETLASWIAQGELKSELTIQDTENAMFSAAASAAAKGERVFAATSGKNLLQAIELLYVVSGWRVPMVLFNVPRMIIAPDGPEPEHNDVLAARDSGFIQIHCATSQEVLDSILLAYRLSEDDEVRMPVLINHEGAFLSDPNEIVDIPNSTAAKQFIGTKIQHQPAADIHRFSEHCDIFNEPRAGACFRYAMHLASQQTLAIYDEVADEFCDFFGRHYPAIMSYRCDDADYVFILMGSFTTSAETAIDQLRANGWKVGLLRPRLLRPFPKDMLVKLLQGKRAVAVLDKHLSPGMGGILHCEVLCALYGHQNVPAIAASFIVSPGVYHINAHNFFEMTTILHKAAETGETPPPRPLLSQQTNGKFTVQ
ncbi:MAG: pyruvate synthase [Gammaproteobacteria bacterium]|jgi:pyruvate ferredoxin oxidoreductase alpha subunit